MNIKQLGGLAFLKKIKHNLPLTDKSKTESPSLFKMAMDFIYPDNLYCLCCGDCIDRRTRIHSLCDSCIKKINWISDNPYASSMEDYAFDQLLSCCIYGALPGKIIRDFKLKGHKYISRPVGKLMAERVISETSQTGVLPSDIYDGICCIPISKEKRMSRGFNQAELLAREISKELQIPYWQALSKTRETVSLRLSSDFERRTALCGVFKVEDHFKVFNEKSSAGQPKSSLLPFTIPKEKIKGSRILLVDDVFTTGSTMNEVALTLKNAGASKVTALVFACGTGKRKQ